MKFYLKRCAFAGNKLTNAALLYDSEYDNYGPSSLASDGDLYDDGPLAGRLIGGEDKIRRVSQHITRSFGQSNQQTLSTSSDSDDA